MVIKSIKLNNAHNTNIFRVLCESGEVLLHGDIIVKFKIGVGEVEDKVFAQAVSESNTLIASEKIMKYISNKLKTKQQIKDYLYKQGYHKETVNSAIEKLENYGLIDDKKYAISYMHSNPNYSKNKLKQKLIALGVKQEILNEILTDVNDSETCIKHAEKFLKNKEFNEKTKEKLIRHLASKGYGFDTIKSVLYSLNLDEF